MRDVKFRLYPGTGGATPSWEHAPLDEFLLTAPLFINELKAFGVIPPLHVLNEKLAAGKCDAGMGGACDWTPFELDIDEYKTLVMELTTNPDYEIIEDEELKEKPNFRKWHGALLSKYAKKVRGSR